MSIYGDMQVDIHERDLDFLLDNPRGDVGRYMHGRAQLQVQLAKRQVGVHTGRTRDSIHAVQRRDARGQYVEIIADSSVALMHHEGTRPHVIIGSSGRVLRFMRRGQVVFARRVLHPGTRPNRFLSDTLVVWRG